MNTDKKMLNPCNPCVCPGAPCEQCTYGYRSKEENHESMKKLLLAVDAGAKPYGWKSAERYMQFHSDWREIIGETVQKEEKNTIYEKLKPHIGHNIVCACYGDPDDPVDICIECEDCNEVLISAESFDNEDTIVHCKGCGYYISKHHYCNRPCESLVERFPDDFCSRGVRSVIDASGAVIDETLKQKIKHKAIKNTGTQDDCFIRYEGRLYYVNYKEDRVTLQTEVK